MNEFWEVTLQMIDGKLIQETGYNYAETDADLLNSMYEKAVSILETSDDANLQKLFAVFIEFQKLPADLKNNEEVKLYYFGEFKKLLK